MTNPPTPHNSPPLRILMIISHFAPTIGGAERQAEQLSRALMAAGHHVEVLTLALADMPPEESLDGLRIHRKLRGIPVGPFWGWTYARSVRRFLMAHKNNFDLLHAHQLYIHAAVAAAAKKEIGLPVIAKASSAGISSDFARLARNRGGKSWIRQLQNLDRVICVTRQVEEECRQWGIPPDRCLRIPNFVNTERFNFPRARPFPVRRLLFVGRLDHFKAPDHLLEAFAILHTTHPDVTLTLVGGGEEREKLSRFCAEKNLNRVVHFAGEQKDALPSYKEADAVIIPSRSEGLCNVLLEALAAGLPVVATAVGGNPEGLGRETVDGRLDLPDRGWIEADGGLLCAPGDPAAMARAMAALVEDSNLAARLSATGRARAESVYDMKSVVARYQNLYEELTQ
ncbi:MAG: glycosyltransferase family 4 protein [bacterium]